MSMDGLDGWWILSIWIRIILRALEPLGPLRRHLEPVTQPTSGCISAYRVLMRRVHHPLAHNQW